MNENNLEQLEKEYKKLKQHEKQEYIFLNNLLDSAWNQYYDFRTTIYMLQSEQIILKKETQNIIDKKDPNLVDLSDTEICEIHEETDNKCYQILESVGELIFGITNVDSDDDDITKQFKKKFEPVRAAQENRNCEIMKKKYIK
jgi:hypothetical protein